MTQHTVAAVYETAAQAAAAVRDLQAANILPDAISQHTKTFSASDTGSSAPPRDQGFWASLFGSEPEHDTTVYDRSIESGSSVLTVRVPDEGVDRVTSILEAHHPIDLDESAAQYTAQDTTSRTAPAGSRAATTDEDTIRLAEEDLSVGKRSVSGGTTRVRRYVVETPVEEQVALRGEKVVVDRRPVSGGPPAAEFTDKTIEMTEVNEEPVVSKTARVTEEVRLHKEATDRVETIRDTVRRDEVEIEQEAGGGRATIPPRPNSTEI
jgi:uncharacterized protein (TIGR02271 family)